MLPTATITLYTTVLFVHIAAAVIAFGVLFAYPLVTVLARRAGGEAQLFWHRAQGAIGRYVITPAATVVLLAGLYLVLDGPWGFEEVFVGTGLVIVFAILGICGAYFAPTERRLAALVESEGGGDSPQYATLARQLVRVQCAAAGLALIALFLMVTKPGA